MGEFFGNLYCWPFEDFMGLPLADYLWGISSPLSTSNQFSFIGLIMLGVSLFIAVLYYLIINSSKLRKWWCWLIFLGINATINFFLGWQLILSDFYKGKMVAVSPDDPSEYIPLLIAPMDILKFGIANTIIAILTFFIISLIIKRWSRNCCAAPF